MKSIYVLSACLLAVGGQSAVLSTVPMQGGMVMPEFAYHEADGTLTLSLSTTIPQLTPLLVSNPGDSFDPAAPWFEALDPSREGRSFSRRYGFTMDVMSDPMPPGTAIRIRKISSTPGLEAYRYGAMSKVWEPVFGTAGSSLEYLWDGSMFHPAFTAPPGTNSYSALFDAELVVTGTGEAIVGTKVPAFTLEWTNVPDGRPTLQILPGVTLLWPAAAANYVLESSDSSVAGTWSAVLEEPVLVGDQLKVTLAPASGQRYFRLRLQ